MADKIKLVARDNRPYITLTLTDPVTGLAINVAGATVAIKVYFRAVGSTTILATLTCTKPNGGADGVVQFSFTGTTLSVAAGAYEGEIEIDFDTSNPGTAIQTVYETLKFQVRDQFA